MKQSRDVISSLNAQTKMSQVILFDYLLLKILVIN
jgi:hypothetical protein